MTSDRNARRLPLCFLSRLEERGYGLEVETDGGVRCRLARLGFDLEPLKRRIEACRRDLHRKTCASLLSLDPTLSAADAENLARLMPDGAGAPLDVLERMAPSFLQAALAAVDAGADGPAREGETDAEADEGVPPATTDANDVEDAAPPPSTGIAFIRSQCAPNRFLAGMKSHIDGQGAFTRDFWFVGIGNERAVVEFALADGEASASFAFRMDADVATFSDRLIRALEALSFNRACIRLTDDELAQRGNDVFAMALDRTPALRFLRERFDGRIIHSSQSAWERAVRIALG